MINISTFKDPPITTHIKLKPHKTHQNKLKKKENQKGIKKKKKTHIPRTCEARPHRRQNQAPCGHVPHHDPQPRASAPPQQPHGTSEGGSEEQH